VGLVAALFGGSAAYLRIRLIHLAGGVPSRVHRAVEGRLATVVDEVGGPTTGRVVVDAGSEDWYLAARPVRSGRYGPGTRVVVVALDGGTALVASPEEIGP
jgi:membrane protein implicated in regulation of membrane protease activity